jgi:hypothetical protein
MTIFWTGGAKGRGCGDCEVAGLITVAHMKMCAAPLGILFASSTLKLSGQSALQ